MSDESERPACPNCGAIPPLAARGATLAFCSACDIAHSHHGMIVASGLKLMRHDGPTAADCAAKYRPPAYEEEAIAAGYHSPQFIQMFLGFLMAKVPEMHAIEPQQLLDLFADFEGTMMKDGQ